MALEDLELEIEPQDIELEIEPVKKKSAKKPKKATLKQEFKTPLPTSIPEQIQSSQFKFETTPFRETPGQYILRSTPDEKLSPQEKLKRERSLSLRANRPLDIARAETPEEREETLRIGKAQEIQDKYGAGALRLRSGLGTAGAMLAEPFKSAEIETRNILSGNILAPIAEREAEMEKFRKPLSQGVNTGYDPLGSALETGIAVGGSLLATPRGGRSSILGTEPFRGGARVGVRPPIVNRPPPPPSPKLLGIGEGPPVSSMKQNVPLLSPPPVRSPIGYLPPPPGRLAKLDPGPVRPMADFGIMSQNPRGWERGESGPVEIKETDDLTFDLLPAMRPGQAPVMLVPQWVIDIVQPGAIPGSAGGLNILSDSIPSLYERIRIGAPEPKHEHARVAIESIAELARASKDEGLETISLIGHESAYNERLRAGFVSHETFHAGQTQVGTEKMQHPTTGIHGVGWAINSPHIREIMAKFPNKMSPDKWASELPAYVAGRQHTYSLGVSKDTDFLYDYLEHIMDLHGQDALDVLQGPTRLSPEITEIFNSIRSTYESKRSQLGITPRSLPTGESQRTGSVGGIGRSLSGYESTGIGTRGDQGEVGGVVGGAESTSAGVGFDERQSNARKFVEKADPRLRLPSGDPIELFHGTSSPTEIGQVDPSKFDPDALYGPGFYMTQSPEIAAGGEGSYVNKVSKSMSDDDINNEITRRLVEIGVMAPGEDLTGLSLRVEEREGADSPKIGLIDRIVEEVQNQAYENKPHAYKLHANIERPFDVDEMISPKEVERLLIMANQRAGFDPQDLDIVTEASGQDVYRSIVSGFDGDKASANQLLKDAGYDGITHIGGINKSVSPKFDTVDDAVEYAQRVGGRIRGINEYTEEGLNKWVVEGHRVWIAFNPQQVKSATGNVGTFEGMALSEKPSYEIGDRVKIRGMSGWGDATITELTDDGIKVRYDNGKTEELEFHDIIPGSKTSAAPIDKSVPTPIKHPDVGGSVPQPVKEEKIVKPSKKGGVPNLPGPMRIRGSRLHVNRIAPGDEPGTVKIEFGNGTVSQFPLKEVKDAGGKKIKDPIIYMYQEEPPTPASPVPPTPNNPAFPPGGPYPPLHQEIVSVPITRVVARKFEELMDSNNIRYDHTKAPSVQVWEALFTGKLRDNDVELILQDEGMSWEDFAEDVFQTYSVAGSTLQPLSQIEQRHWKKLRDENPALFNKLVPAHRQIGLILDDLNKTVLGMSLWRRSGRMVQKAVLTQASTAMVNFMTATGRVPLDSASSVIGQIMRGVVEEEGTFVEKMNRNRENIKETFKAGFEAWRALNPTQINNLRKHQLGAEYARHEEIVSQLEQYFPDIHSKLFARPMEESTQKLEKASDKVKDMKKLLPKVKNKEKRRRLQNEVNDLASKVAREEKLLMKIGFRAPEYFYDQLLRPMQFGEFLMRRARFASRLGLELRDKGIDLNEVMQKGTFKDVPEESVKAALNDALEFTMAMEPTQGESARNLETVAYHAIRVMNKLGPVAAMTDTLFLRAMYSAFNTWYDYSPIPLLNPVEYGRDNRFGRIFRGKDDIDPATGEPYRVNPSTREDYDKLGKAFVGTFLYLLAFGLIKAGLIGDEWYQLKTLKKDEKGNPVYADIRRYIPQARIMQLAHLVHRMQGRNVNDVQVGKELLDITTGMKRFESDPDAIGVIDATAEYWLSPEDDIHKWDKSKQVLGKLPAAFLTPFLNLRSISAMADEDENVRKDLKGWGFRGPSLDRIPLARQVMPDLQIPGYQDRIKLSQHPGLQQLGLQLAASPGFMGREFQRMGINIRKVLPKDSDPDIDRRQTEVFNQMIEFVSNMMENDPSYMTSTDTIKAAMWEPYLQVMVSEAKKAGLEANIPEATRRAIIDQVPGRFTRRALGIHKELEGLRER